MRFGMRSLFFGVFFAASLMAVWTLRHPWEISRVQSDLSYIRPDFWFGSAWARFVSPDHTRYFDAHDGGTAIYRFEVNSQISERTFEESQLVWDFSWAKDNPGWPIGFIDDNTFVFDRFGPESEELSSSKYVVWRRRFPEWWWGHLYRPEIWISGLLGLTWLWLVVHRVPAKAIVGPVPAHPTVKTPKEPEA